ncbi:MAG: nitroreductase family protein [bacterium]
MLKIIKEYLVTNYFIVGIRLIPDIFFEFINLVINLGESKMFSNKSKFEAFIKMETHAIEKGLSLPKPRVNFREQKINNLLLKINYYLAQFNDIEFITYPLGIVKEYIDCNNSPAVFFNYNKIIDTYKLGNRIPENIATTIIKNSSNTIITTSGYEQFVLERHSIRNFADKKVNIELINKALSIANNCPSACNRQPWKTYIFVNPDSRQEILDLQGGSKGFNENIQIALLITSNLNDYFLSEQHQSYIDGGLFAMSLIYALHSLGLGTIPLTLSLKRKKNKEIMKKFNIPANESLIMVIGVGYPNSDIKVAHSLKKVFTENTIYL